MASAIRAEVVLPLIRERARRLAVVVNCDATATRIDRITVGILVDLIDVIDQLTPRTEETTP